MSFKVAAAPLRNETATSAPRSGAIGVLPVDDLPDAKYVTRLRIAVICPSCSNYATVEGQGEEYRNITKMLEPTFCCSVCSWRPSNARDTPQQWRVYYAGRLGGTLIWSVNEEHMEVLVRFLETQPRRRKRVEFPWEYKALMSRLPIEATSGRSRNDMVSLLKKLQKTRPRGV